MRKKERKENGALLEADGNEGEMREKASKEMKYARQCLSIIDDLCI